MKRSVVVACLAAALAASPVGAQSPSPVPANVMLPREREAPISDWVPADKRSLLSLPVDGGTLRGYLYHGSDPALKLTVLFFNGSGGTLDGAQFPAYLAAQGPDVASYDYRGRGFSTGTPDVMTFRRDALKAFDATARAAGGPSHVVVAGYSFGTPFAAYVASERPVRALALISTMASLRREWIFLQTSGGRLSRQEAEAVTFAPDAHEAFGVTELVAKSTAPLLVIHGADDNIVSPDQGRDVFNASPSKSKRFVLLPAGAKHNAPGQPASIAALKALFLEVRS